MSWWNGGGEVPGCNGAWNSRLARSYNLSRVDLSGFGNRLWSRNRPFWSRKRGWTLDGFGQYLSSGLTSLPVGTMVIECGNVSGSGAIIGRMGTSGTYGIRSVSGGYVRVYCGEGQADFSPFRSSGIFILSGNRFYFGKDLVGEVLAREDVSSGAIDIGRLNAGSFMHMKGDVHLASVYSRILSGNEVAMIVDSINGLSK